MGCGDIALALSAGVAHGALVQGLSRTPVLPLTPLQIRPRLGGNAVHVTDALPSGAAEGDGGLEWASFRLCLHRGQTRFRPAGTVLWWRPHGILLHQVAAFQAQHLPHPRRRHRCLHRFLHNLTHSKVDTELVMVLVALADVDVVDVDVVDADEVDVDEEDEDEADVDEAGADEADAVWPQRVA